MSEERDALREQLAALAHDRWCAWMTHLFRFVEVDEQGHWIMAHGQVERWRWQMQRPYEELSAAEQDSDRAEADRVLALLPPSERDALIAAVVAEYAAALARAGAWETPALLGPAEQSAYLMGARAALRRVADRLGVVDLHARAAEVVARGDEDEGREP